MQFNLYLKNLLVKEPQCNQKTRKIEVNLLVKKLKYSQESQEQYPDLKFKTKKKNQIHELDQKLLSFV